jgi:hypothetical protein
MLQLAVAVAAQVLFQMLTLVFMALAAVAAAVRT